MRLGAYSRFAAVGLVAIVVIACATGSFSMPAGAAVTPGGTAGTVTPAIVGLPASISLAGPNASEQLTIPPSQGVAWSALQLRVDWPLGISSGALEATDQNGRLGVLSAPTAPGATQLWTVPVRATAGQPYTMTLTANVEQQGTQVCGASGNPTVVAYPLALGFASNVQPDSVGDYLAGPISTLVVRTPEPVGRSVAEAALQLVGTVVADDLDRDVHVDVVPVGAAVTAVGPFTRVVTFDPGVPAGISLSPSAGAGLVIGGSGAALLQQVALFGSRLVPALQIGAARAIRAPGVVRQELGTVSLAELGLTSTTASGIGTFSIPIGFDQMAFGTELSGAQLQLSGHNAAIPTAASAAVTLLASGAPVATTPLGNSGRWALDAAVPPLDLNRFVDLQLQVRYTTSQGYCSAFQTPLDVSVDPSSTITVTPGRPPTAPGFLEVPQLLAPEADVVLAPFSYATFALGAQLVADLQRMSTTPLQLSLAPGPALPGGGTPAIVVAEHGSALARRLLPTGVASGTVSFATAHGTTVVAVDPSEAVLSVAHPSSGDATVALIGSTSGHGRAGALLDAIGDLPTHWFSLTGDVAALSPSGVVVTAQVTGSPGPTLTAASAALLSHRWIWAVLGALAAALAALVTELFLGRRRRRAAALPTPDERGDDRPWGPDGGIW
ncbi:MAG TPA: hypothetical protein VMU75_05545 [Acidimicrobiales bacterium]|nr:hypothetical protein [Acidimicrobiales bacterium]